MHERAANETTRDQTSPYRDLIAGKDRMTPYQVLGPTVSQYWQHYWLCRYYVTRDYLRCFDYFVLVDSDWDTIKAAYRGLIYLLFDFDTQMSKNHRTVKSIIIAKNRINISLPC